jgi:protein-tyrosine phosphatase
MSASTPSHTPSHNPSHTPTDRPADPASWWRTLCWVTDRLVVSGDLPSHGTAARRQLARWVDAGITHVVDVRGECNDVDFVARHAPDIRYLWAPTHDSGGAQPHHWFTDTTDWILSALADDPAANVLVHCHMGVNRAPSMAMATMMAMGTPSTAALDAIRSARPIAGIIYADQAADWFHKAAGSNGERRRADIRAIHAWHRANPVDVSWVVSRIAQRGDLEFFAGHDDTAA